MKMEKVYLSYIKDSIDDDVVSICIYRSSQLKS